jgi:putative metallohydrolase (TIGR04338 family)
MARDFQRSKLYKAERKVLPLFDKSELFSDMNELKAYCELIKETDYWKKHKGWKRVKVKDGRARQSACYWSHDRSVAFPKGLRTPCVAIHEMAHCLTHKTTGDNYVGHGTHFCGHYIKLVNELLGYEMAMKLQKQFDEDGVRYHFL